MELREAINTVMDGINSGDILCRFDYTAGGTIIESEDTAVNYTAYCLGSEGEPDEGCSALLAIGFDFRGKEQDVFNLNFELAKK